jgi:hypothetical protein
MQRHDSGMLRLHDGHGEIGLHVLRDDEQRARMLRLLNTARRL